WETRRKTIQRPAKMANGTIDYDLSYPEVPAGMDTKQLAELLHTNEQIVRAWVGEGVIPAHRKPGVVKLTFLRHEVFEWLSSDRYDPEKARHRRGRSSTTSSTECCVTDGG